MKKFLSGLLLLITTFANAVIVNTPTKVHVEPPLQGNGTVNNPVKPIINEPGGFIVLDDSGSIPEEVISSTTIKTPNIVYGSNFTLGQGATFYAFVAVDTITLVGLTTTLIVQGSTGQTTWRCGDGTNNLYTVTTSTMTVGSRSTASGNVDINKNTEVTCLIESTTQNETPTGAVILQFLSH